MSFAIRILTITATCSALISCSGSDTKVCEDIINHVGSVTAGQTMSRQSPCGTSDIYTLSATKGTTYLINVRSITGDADIALRSSNDLEAIDNIIVYSVNASSPGYSNIDTVAYTAELTATHYIEINIFDNSQYELAFTELTNNEIGIATSSEKMHFNALLPYMQSPQQALTVEFPFINLVSAPYVNSNYTTDSILVDNTGEWALLDNKNLGHTHIANITPDTHFLEAGIYTAQLKSYMISNTGSFLVYKTTDLEYQVATTDIPVNTTSITGLQGSINTPPGVVMNTILEYGPPGMTLSGDVISWNNTYPLFTPDTSINYGITLESTTFSNTFDLNVVFTDDTVQEPLARGYGSLFFNSLVKIGDLDNNGINDIVLAYDYNISTTEYLDGQYRQTWAYPFVLDKDFTIGEYNIADINQDGWDDLILADSNSKQVFTLNGRDRTTTKRTEQTPGTIRDIKTADIDNDGELEHALWIYYGGDTGMAIYNSNFDTLEWESNIFINYTRGNVRLFDNSTIYLSNTDTDPYLEVITDIAIIIDIDDNTRDYVNILFSNWYVSGVLIGEDIYDIDFYDFNSDGIDEIIYAGANGVQVYDPATRSRLGTIGSVLGKVSYINVWDIDSDPSTINVSTLFGATYFTYTYDSTAGEFTLTDTATLPAFTNLGEAVAGELNGDNFLDFVTMRNSGSPDASLIIGSIQPGIDVSHEITNSELARGSFYDTFITGVADSKRIHTLSPGGSVGNIYEYSNSAPYLQHMASTDYAISDSKSSDINNDGSLEFVIAQNPPDNSTAPYFLIIDPANSYSASRYYLPLEHDKIYSLDTHDINGDGYPEVIAHTLAGNFSSADTNRIVIYDVANSSVISDIQFTSSSYHRSNPALYATSLNVDGLSHAYITINSEVYIATYDQTGALTTPIQSATSMVGYTADQLNTITLPETGLKALMLRTDGRGSNRLLFLDENLNTIKSVNLSSDITFVQPLLNNNGNIIYYAGHYPAGVNNASHISVIDQVTGKELWKSPMLIGRATKSSVVVNDINNDGRQDLVFGTGSYLYITR